MNTKTQSKAQVALIENACKGFKAIAANDDVIDFLKMLLRFPNPEQAAAILVEQMGLVYDAAHPELHEAAFKQPDLDRRFENSAKHLEELENAVRSIPPKIKSNAAHVGSTKAKVTFSDWALMDRMSCVLIGIAAIGCLIMSTVNVYSNLKSSGDPIYIENPLIPLFISMLAPSCSVAIKFLSNIFEHHYFYKKCFTNFVFLSSGASFIVWVGLFSAAYSGPASGIDWSALAESTTGNLESWLAFTQLLTEILIGGALFLALQDICLKYSPDYYEDNLAYIAAVKARDTRLALHVALQDQRNQNHIRLTVLKAERQAFVNEKLAEFVNLKTRFTSLNNF